MLSVRPSSPQEESCRQQMHLLLNPHSRAAQAVWLEPRAQRLLSVRHKEVLELVVCPCSPQEELRRQQTHRLLELRSRTARRWAECLYPLCFNARRAPPCCLARRIASASCGQRPDAAAFCRESTPHIACREEELLASSSWPDPSRRSLSAGAGALSAPSGSTSTRHWLIWQPIPDPPLGQVSCP